MIDDTIFMIILLYYADQQQKKNALIEKKRRRRERRFRTYLSADGRRRRDRRIPRVSLRMPCDLPWEKIFRSANDQSLITLTGFDFASFNMLHGHFVLFFNYFTPHRAQQDGTLAILQRPLGGDGVAGRGRKRIITSDACLALLLVYSRTTVPNFMLSVLFGLSGTAVSLYIRFARLIVIHLLQNHPLAKITLPTNEEVAEYKLAIAAKYPLLKNVYCVADGLKISIQAAGQQHVQRRFYNGWQKDHCISNVFVFAPDGTIIAAALNMPGCCHDSFVAEYGFIYGKLEEVNARVPDGAVCVMDSAFSADGKPYVLKSIQAHIRAENAEEYLMYEEATSVRQAAEWGMRGLRSSFGRLTSKLRYETDGQRSQILDSIVLLYNWRANTVGFNEIRTVFMPHLNKNVDQYIFGDGNY
jgi:hypothetical protein